MFTIIIQNSSSKLLFQFLQWLFSSFIPSTPSPPLPSTPHTNSCKLTIWGASPFQHHTRWKPLGFVLEGMLWSKKFPFPKKIGTGILVFETLNEVELFLYKRAMHFGFQNAWHLFFFPLVPFGRITRKEKRNKKKEPPYGALCWIKPKEWGVLELSTHPSWFKWALFFFFSFGENAWLQNNSDDEK